MTTKYPQSSKFISLLLSLFACALSPAFSQVEKPAPAIVPLPHKMVQLQGEFMVRADTEIFVEKGNLEALRTGRYLAELLSPAMGRKIEIVETEKNEGLTNGILLTAQGAEETLGSEGYVLSVRPDEVVIRASTGAALFYGVQTLRQLLPAEIERRSSIENINWTVPCILIEDSPQYSWRGMHLDVARHFFSKEFIKNFIDVIAQYKINRFHLHLTDDQGWRIEIKRYPALTEKGAWRDDIGWRLDPASSQHYDEQGRYGGYYSQDDLREIIAYADERHITIIPEIDVPGHSMAALTQFPELTCTGAPEKVFCAGNEKSYEFLEHVFAEVAALFPAEYVHIGADEVFKGLKWGDCTLCQEKIKEEGLKDTHELQSYFSRRVENILKAYGKEIIGWDEVHDDELSLDAMMMGWRGMQFATKAAQRGHDVIMCPTVYCYFDYIQGEARFEPTGRTFRVVPLEKVYSFEPVPTDLPAELAKHIIGVQGCIWSEYIPNEQQVEYMAFPRLFALAEVAWTHGQLRDWVDFQKRMFAIFPRLEMMNVNYRLPNPETAHKTILFSGEAAVTFKPAPDPEVRIRYTLDGTTPDVSSPEFEESIAVTRTSEIRASYFNRYGRQSPPTLVQCIKNEAVHPDELEPGLYARYAEGTWKKMPSLSDLSSAELKKVDGFDLGIRQRDDDFTVHFTGYIKIEQEGLYTFTLGSDDRSTLSIGSRQVFDNDGRQRYKEVSGDIYAAAGIYPLAVGYLESHGGERLQVFVEGPGLEKQPLPASMLYRR